MVAARRGLIGLLSAEAVSFTGTRMSMVAIPWYVLTTTGDAVALGLVTFAETAPLVVARALSGPAIDRLGPRRVSVLADVISGGAVAAIPLLHMAGGLRLWALVALVAVVGTARGPGDTAKMAMVPAVAETAGTALERVTGLTGAIDRLAQTVGPLLAGVLVAGFGPLTVVLADAASFAAAAAIVAGSVPGRGAGAGVGDDSAGQGYLGQLRGGFDFLRRERLLRSLVAMIGVTNLIDAAVLSVLLPLWARESGAGPAGIGLVAGASGAVAVAGSVVAAAVAQRMPRRTTYLVANLLGGAPKIAVLALGGPLWLVVAVWAFAGISSGVLNPIIAAVIYERIPRPLLGRVLTLAGTVAQTGVPVGGLAAGAVVAGAGLVPTVLVCATGYLVTTMLPLRRPEWREMDRLTARTGPAPGPAAAAAAPRSRAGP